MNARTLPGYEYIVSFPGDLYDRVDVGDVLEVSAARCGKADVEGADGYVAVLYKWEWEEDGKRRWCLGLSPIAQSVGELTLGGTRYYNNTRDVEIIGPGDSASDPKWVVIFPLSVFPGVADDLGVRYRQTLELILAPAS